jgi:hypothetical protein
MITGVVFEDADSDGKPGRGEAPLAGVEVVLDGRQHAKTDAQGRYTFERAAYGGHTVEVFYESSRAFYFTSPSRVETESNTEVNFGVSFSRSQVFGFVRSDAGLPVAGVEVVVRGEKEEFRARTNGDGKYRVQGLVAGEYEIALDAATVPAGYRLDHLAPQRAGVAGGVPAEISFTLSAIRSLTGRVTIYDTGTTQHVPAAGLTVILRELARRSVTDEDGVFLFRNLPAGEFTLVVVYEGKEVVRRVTLPAGPAFVKDAHIDLGAMNLGAK